MRERRLRKSSDQKVCGVCGGLGEYFGIDPTIIRGSVSIFVSHYILLQNL